MTFRGNNVTMTEMTVAELKRRFAYVLERVAQGERFVVTKRGRPVAVVASLPTEPEEPAPVGVLALMGALEGEGEVDAWAASVDEVVAGRQSLPDRDPPDLG